MFITYNYWSISIITNQITFNKYFDNVHKFVLDGISENMVFMVQTGEYGFMRTADPKKVLYYVVKFIFDTVELQHYNTTDLYVLKAG